MTITTPSRTRNPRRLRKSGFTLVEVMVSAVLGALIIAAVMSSFLFLIRSGTNIQNYSDMESQSRKALEVFAEDVRQASAISFNSEVSITLTVNSTAIVYAYTSSDGQFSRTAGGNTRVLITGITPNTFKFRAFSIADPVNALAISTAAERTSAGVNTKQLQISLEAFRTNRTVVAATNSVLSARFILRNKVVTA